MGEDGRGSLGLKCRPGQKTPGERHGRIINKVKHVSGLFSIKISIPKKFCLFFYFYSLKIHGCSRTDSKLRNVSSAANQHIGMISEGPCDTETWSELYSTLLS